MKTFRKKWNNVAVQDDICVMSKEAKSFVTAFRNMLRRTLDPFGISVVSLTPNHYDCSGFVEKDGKYVYLSYSIPRYGQRISFSDSSVMNGVLYRTAEGPKDFRGGSNQFSSIEKISDNIIRMIG